MAYPKPEIGFYISECCILDLYQISSQEELDDALTRVEDNYECGDLMVFRTLEEAQQALGDDY